MSSDILWESYRERRKKKEGVGVGEIIRIIVVDLVIRIRIL
jgi:hypothetical protein